jgi:hypothetical protein
MGSVIAAVRRHERSLVRAQALRLDRLVGWRPGVSWRVRRRVCVQVAAIAPQLASARLAVLVRHRLCFYRLERQVAAAGGDLATTRRLRRGVEAVISGGDSYPEDALLLELAHLRRTLSHHDPGGRMVACYGGSLRDSITAAAQLRAQRDAATAAGRSLTAERYLELAAHTVDYRSFAYALLALAGEELTGPQLQSIDAALWHGAYAVRLASDLSEAGGRRRGPLTDQSVVGLPTAAGQVATPGYVWDATDRHVEAHDAVLATLTGLGAIPAASTLALTRCLTQSIRLHRQFELP